MRTQLSFLALPLAFALALGACAGDSPGKVQRKCTKSLYELCITEHDCVSENCQNVAGNMICTVGCDASNPCPDLNGTKVSCDANVCKPPEVVDCEVVPQ